MIGINNLRPGTGAEINKLRPMGDHWWRNYGKEKMVKNLRLNLSVVLWFNPSQTGYYESTVLITMLLYLFWQCYPYNDHLFSSYRYIYSIQTQPIQSQTRLYESLAWCALNIKNFKNKNQFSSLPWKYTLLRHTTSFL